MKKIFEYPISGDAYENIDQVGLSEGIGVKLQDGNTDEAGNTQRRPGLKKYFEIDAGFKIEDFYWWEYKKLLIVVSNKRVYKIDKNLTVTDITGDTLAGTYKPIFVDNGDSLLIADGGRIVYTNGTANTAYIGDADAPIKVTHVAFLDTYIFCNNLEDTNKIYYSDAGSISSWSATNFKPTESKADKVVALKSVYNMVMVIGTQSTEYYRTYDGGIMREDGMTSENGTISPYTLILSDGVVYYLDNKRNFVMLQDRVPVFLSLKFNKVFKNIGDVSDAFTYEMDLEGRFFIVLLMGGRCFVYEKMLKTWQEWGYWNRLKTQYENYLGYCGIYIPDWNVYLTGSRKNGKIFETSYNFNDDDGNTIRTLRITPNVDHGIPQFKKIEREITIKLKKSINALGSAEPKIMIRYRNNDENQWSQIIELVFNRQALTVTIRNLGSYYSRQYEIICTDSVGYYLCKMFAKVEILGG